MTPFGARLTALPLRRRLVLGFSIATFVVLLSAGGFVYWRVTYALDRDIDTELSSASDTIAPLVNADGSMSESDLTRANATGVAWQVLTGAGRVLDHGGAAGPEALVGERRLDRATDAPHVFNVGDFLPVDEDPYRLQVSPLSSGQYLLVGVDRSHRDEALRELLLQLSVAGLIAMLLTAFVGDRLARAALQPVERYRRQASAIAEGHTTLRLDVPHRRNDEISRLGHTFNEMLSTLDEALDRERQFVNDASHELRTPITLLTSRVQLAMRRSRTAEEHERILTELKIDLDRLADLADQLLQVGSAHDNSAQRSSDLDAVASRVLNQRRLADPPRATDLIASLSGQPVRVGLADPAVERILTNLLDNAGRHGAPPVHVVVDAPAEGWARLQVSDRGDGMSAALLETATQRFTRSEEARAKPGSGLGLSLVETLVRGAGGELRLCHAGRHRHRADRSGPTATAPDCSHGPEMTITAWLPMVSAFTGTSFTSA